MRECVKMVKFVCRKCHGKIHLLKKEVTKKSEKKKKS